MLVYNIPPIPKPMYENIESGSNSLPIEKANKLEEIKGDAYDEEDDDDEEEEEEDNECVICLESLNPGDKVGRLECLCVFHYKCIKDWFNKKVMVNVQFISYINNNSTYKYLHNLIW